MLAHAQAARFEDFAKKTKDWAIRQVRELKRQTQLIAMLAHFADFLLHA